MRRRIADYSRSPLSSDRSLELVTDDLGIGVAHLRTLLISTAFYCISLASASSQTGAVANSFAGWSGNKQVSLDEQNDSLDVTICPGDSSTQHRIIRDQTRRIIGIKRTDAKRNSPTRRIEIVFAKGEKLGIATDVAQVTGALSKATVRLERAQDRSIAIAFNSWASCPRIGYFPGTILVLVCGFRRSRPGVPI